MVSSESFHKLALSFNQVSEKPHFDKASFRIKEKIFATLDSSKNQASLKLSEIQQSIYCQVRPTFAVPATGAWGKQGWTIFDLKKVPKKILAEALRMAYQNVAPKEKIKAEKSSKEIELIQTLHPDKTKTNKKISLEKYNKVKDMLLNILQSKELTHSELMEVLYQDLKKSFVGGIQWYGETVKLDLEARKIIERTSSKPEKYRLKSKKRS